MIRQDQGAFRFLGPGIGDDRRITSVWSGTRRLAANAICSQPLTSLSECLCVRHKLMAKEPRYATQTQG
ncbi:hypothetical protein DF161_07755, partial [Burkholderia stagnalis]